MKNLLLAGLALTSLTFATTACSSQNKTAETTTAPAPATTGSATPAGAGTNAATAAYTCSMHPEVSSDKPGKCPKCGMNLVKK